MINPIDPPAAEPRSPQSDDRVEFADVDAGGGEDDFAEAITREEFGAAYDGPRCLLGRLS
jgi:hypothetical protein